MPKELTLNGEIALTCPDGFREMDAAERGGLNVVGAGEFVALRDDGRHIACCLGWKNVGLAALVLGAKDAARAMAAALKKPMAPFGYRLWASATAMRRRGPR